MRVSIVIPAHNGEATLAECLEACLNQTQPADEVIVVDDGSTDDTARIAEGYDVHYVWQENRGPAAARNRGAAEATGEVVAFTDSDCVPAEDWLEHLTAGFEDGVISVGGTYGMANPEPLLARIVHEEIALRHERFGKEVDFLGSFNVAYRKEAFEAVGGFDEAFTMASGEDNDLAYRLADHGTLRFARDAVVNHYHPDRLRPYLRTQMWHGCWRVKLYRKHPKRKGSGDRYAGTADLLAPGLILLLAMAFAVQVASIPHRVPVTVSGCLVILLVTVYAALRVPMALTLVKRTGNWRMLSYSDMAVLRDCARALGMVRGFWHFVICRKETY
ncbi:MAG: glycosyltransferase [bacterium]|nr:glycosyltransferase [bacterium]